MKKLTAGIFATLLAVVSVDAAQASIASKGYVDDQVEGVSGQVTILSEQVNTNTGDITTLKGDAQTAGSVAKSVADAIASEVRRADGAYDSKGSATQALTDAKSYADTELAKKQNILKSGENVVVNGGGNVISSVTAKDGTVTFTTTSVATSETVTGLTNRVGQVETDLAGKADKSTTLAGYGITDAYTKGEVDSALSGKQATLTTEQQNAVNSGITTEKVATYDGYAAQIAAKADASVLANYVTTENANANYAAKSTEGVASTASTNAQQALTNIGTLTNLTTDAKTNTVAAINEVATEAATAQSTATAAQNAASEAQTDATQALGDAAAAQETANAAIPKPTGTCSNPTAKCVLTYNNSQYTWEVIERGEDGE